MPMQCGDTLLNPSFEDCSNDQYSLKTPSNLESFTEALDQVLRRRRALNDRSQEHDPTGTVSNDSRRIEILGK